MKYEGGIDKILKKGTDLSLGLSESGWGYPIEAAGGVPNNPKAR